MVNMILLEKLEGDNLKVIGTEEPEMLTMVKVAQSGGTLMMLTPDQFKDIFGEEAELCKVYDAS